VTSDKRLAWAARRRLAKTESVEEFLAWLNKRFYNKIRRLKDAEGLKSVKAVSLPKKAIKRDIEPAETIEERFEYYLKIFEGELRDSPVKEKETSHLSDMERWLKAFEDPQN
jgi:hypothetical protein